MFKPTIPNAARILTLDRRSALKEKKEMGPLVERRRQRVRTGEFIVPKHNTERIGYYDAFVEKVTENRDNFDFLIIYKLLGNDTEQDFLMGLEGIPTFMVSQNIDLLIQKMTQKPELEQQLGAFYQKQSAYRANPTQQEKEVNVLGLMHLLYQETRSWNDPPIYLIKHRKGNDKEEKLIETLNRCQGVKGVYLLPYETDDLRLTMDVVDVMMEDKQAFAKMPYKDLRVMGTTTSALRTYLETMKELN